MRSSEHFDFCHEFSWLLPILGFWISIFHVWKELLLFFISWCDSLSTQNISSKTDSHLEPSKFSEIVRFGLSFFSNFAQLLLLYHFVIKRCLLFIRCHKHLIAIVVYPVFLFGRTHSLPPIQNMTCNAATDSMAMNINVCCLCHLHCSNMITAFFWRWKSSSVIPCRFCHISLY